MGARGKDKVLPQLDGSIVSGGTVCRLNHVSMDKNLVSQETVYSVHLAVVCGRHKKEKQIKDSVSEQH